MSVPQNPGSPRRGARRTAALVLVVAVYGMARLPSLPGAERREIASRFAFERWELPTAGAVQARTLRPVHPDLARIESWISSVGAAVALHDLDGDGLPNDVCWVDTRSDRVVVTPAPGTPARYEPFALRPEAGLYTPATMAPMGCLPGDLNEDGRADLLVYYWGRTPLLFLRRGVGAPAADAYRVSEAVPGGERWFSNTAALTDVDGDGHPDLLVGNYFPDGARVLDVRGGGREEMQRSMSRAFNGGRNRVLLWAGARSGDDPEVRFREVPRVFDERVAHGWTLAIATADLDGDLLPEIYFANDFGPDRLLHNRSRPGKPRFALLEGRRSPGTPRSKVLGRDSFKGMGAEFADVDGDGVLDIYVSNIAAEYALQESHFLFVGSGRTDRMHKGVAPFADRSEELGLSRSGWGWEARIADLDNDGAPEALQATGFVQGAVDRWPELQELAMGNDALLHRPGSWPRIRTGDDLSGHEHNPFFVRARDGRFYDLAREVGLGEPQVSRGIALADVDGDGRLDFALANQWAPSLFYRNAAPAPGTFVGLHLVLPTADADAPTRVHGGHPRPGMGVRPALGAQAVVRLPSGEVRVAQVDGGSGHSGKRSPDLHFGLGRHPPGTPVRVELRWRDGEGRVREEVRELLPGWHTVVLGQGGEL
jgi:hypothetical protein